MSPEEDQFKRRGDGSPRPEQNCSYCSATVASKQLGMSGEHSLREVNKTPVAGESETTHTAVTGEAMNIESFVSDGFFTSWLTVGVSRSLLSSTPLSTKFGIQLKASKNNNGIVYIGRSDVTADESATGGHPLAAGERIFLPIDHVEAVSVVANVDGQKLSILVLK